MDKDLLVIGGGINGVGVAADAAGRGLSVILCEMGDLASGTSSASSKLIHGGVRYLENFEFGLVRESLQERRTLRQIAPHLVHVQPFVLPHCPWLRPYWMIRAGLFMYDHLAYDPGMPASSSVDENEISTLGLKPEYTKALRYYDCTEDDSRLVVHVALLAQQHGAEILTRTKLIKAVRHARGWTVTLAIYRKEQPVKMRELTVKCIVNAAGPWVQEVAHNLLHIKTKYHVKLVKGSHIIVPRLFKHDEAFILQNQDDRVVFLIPYLRDFTLIGTTEILLNNVEQPVTVSDAEVRYLCDITNEFVTKKISPQNVLHKYAGIRPLYDEGEKNISKITRDYVLDYNTANPHAPVISIFGGKITTYRHLAEELCDKLKKYFPKIGKSWTRTAYLPGGNFLNTNVEEYKQYLISTYATIPANVLNHYVNVYGMRTNDLLKDVINIRDLGQHFGSILYQREVDFLIKHEWAQTAEDIIWRRGKTGLWLNETQIQQLQTYLSSQI